MKGQVAVRSIAGAAVLLTIGVLVARVGGLLLSEERADGDAVAAPAALEPEAQQRLSVRAIENVRVRVEIDGEQRYTGTLPGGETLAYAAGREAMVELSDLTRAEVRYNGDVVEPLGNLSAGRRLVFLDDAAR